MRENIQCLSSLSSVLGLLVVKGSLVRFFKESLLVCWFSLALSLFRCLLLSQSRDLKTRLKAFGLTELW